MPRQYYVPFDNVSVSAAQDLLELTPADDKPIKLVSFVCSFAESETNEQLRGTIQRRTGAYTSGSGGGTPTIVPVNTIMTAAGFAAERNNTTRATGGTQQILHAEGFPSQGGWQFVPMPGFEPVAIQGEALIVGLETAPGSATTMSGTALVEELP